MSGIEGLEKVREQILKQHNHLTKTLEVMTGGDFTEKLRNIMFDESKEKEKRTKVNKKQATMMLMKTGDIVLKFDDPKDAEKFYEGK